MESLWSKTVSLPERKPLPGNITVDAAVIGAGMAGILTACQLKRRGVEAVVLEADRVGSGQTRNTTAKITAQHGLIYDRLIRQLGEGRAREYARRNQEAVEEYASLIEERRIGCDFERLPACLYAENGAAVLSQESAAARRLGIRAELAHVKELPVGPVPCLVFPEQAQFHPLKFLKAVSEELPVFEGTRAVRVDRNSVVTDRGTVSARHIVFACHFPFVNFPGFYFARMHQERSYVLALEGPPALSAMYYGIGRSGLSFRSAGKALLLGGSSHRTGEDPAEDPWQSLRRRARELYPQSRETAAWSAQDCMPLDGVPYIGRFSPSRPGWYVASGFHKWGMTGSMVSAMLLAEEICGERGGEKSVFFPRRFPVRAALPSLLKDTGKSAKGLLKEILYFPGKEFDTLAPGEGAVIRWCGKKRGAYRDESGAVYLVSTRCPHLGCQLEWNAAEKSWDCPCHGSRFDFRGRLISGPAQRGLKDAEKLEPSGQ